MNETDTNTDVCELQTAIATHRAFFSELYTISILAFGGQSISIKSIHHTAPQKASIL